jgi:hypothetical protein
MKTFGASAPLKELQNKFGFRPEHIVASAKDCWTGITSVSPDGRFLLYDQEDNVNNDIMLVENFR